MAAATEYTKVAQELYLSYFGRPADRNGLINMTEALAAANAPTTTAGLDAAYNSNNTVRALLNSFGTSAESAALYAGSTSQFVTAVFQNLFNRPPQLSGLDFWVKAIDSGSLTLAAAAHSILTGAVTLNGADAALIDKKVAIASNFTSAIDTVAEVNAYNSASAAAAAREMLHSVSSSTDVVAFQPTVNSTLSTLVTNASNGVTTSLTLGQDNVLGTSGNDVFVARIFDNSNTLQSGDVISGGAGFDTLQADIGNSQKFALTAETTGVEAVLIRAQTVATDATDNNTSRTNEVQIDAERMQGVTRWEDNNSRADLLIEDVRIQNNQITKDITIAMVSTDPGNVDFGLYFDQASLRAAPVSTQGAVLRLQLMDTRAADAAATAATPLLNNPYNGFQFAFNGQTVTVRSQEIDQATTYDALLAAVKAAVANTPGIQNFTVAFGPNFTAADTLSGRILTGREIVLTNPGAGTITTPTGSGWLAAAAVPPSSGLHTNILTESPTTIVSLVTSTIVLDDVGRGSTGGDLVIGGLSIGDTSTSKGVDRFEITVERNSKLQTINSTDNALREVSIVNGAVNKGNLTVNGNANGSVVNGVWTPVNPTSSGTPASPTDTALPGTITTNGGNQHDDQYGFHDVRLIDASTMSGDLAFTSVITDLSYAKYITTTDSQAGPKVDNIDFIYTGGSGNDTISVDINGGVAGSRSHLVSGLEDFTFTLNGGAGNDILTVRTVNNNIGTPADLNWLNNQDLNNNITINGGDGNNTIRKIGAGDSKITSGSGNDTIYAENSGAKAAFVFNTSTQGGSQILSNLRSDTIETYNLIGTKVNVTFKGIATTSAVTLGATASDLEINQAIKAAINTDPVLSKLLIATDGPAGVLVVTSLIDGVIATTDLTVAMVAPTTLTQAQIDAGSAAYGLTGANATAANVLAAVTTSLASFNNGGVVGGTSDYATAYAQTDAPGSITGGFSTAISDNLITAGGGNDVIVLGTTADITSTAVSSNDTVAFGTAFGNDTIVNFQATGFGQDFLDFNGLGGSTFGAALTADKSITVAVATAANTKDATTTAETKIAAFFNANNTAAQTHVYVSYDANGVGSVYKITDAAGAGNAVANLEGTIHLGAQGTVNNWSALTASNFVDSSAANYYLQNGAAGFTAPPVSGGTTSALLSGGTTTIDANPTGVVAVSVAAVAHTAAVTNFSTGDSLVFAPGTTFAFNDANFSDNLIQVTATQGGVATILNVTAPTGVTWSAINSAADFAAVTGGSLVSEAAALTTTVTAAGTFDAATGGANTYAVTPAGAGAGYTVNIANFTAHDVLSFVAGTTLSTASNTNVADGIVDLVATNGVNNVTIHLTGLPASVDAALGTAPLNFNSVFGAGTLVGAV